jgi:carboxypeptidase family protein
MGRMHRIAILALLAASPAAGCVCAAFLTPKAEWQDSSLVFVGKVETASPEFDAQKQFRPQHATVRVEEAFKGVQKGQLIEIDQTGSDCELKYSRGWRRLLYLSMQRGGLWMSPGCDRSKDPDSASDDLRFLRALPASGERTRISGEVTSSGKPNRPLSGVTVTIAQGGGPDTTAVTDATGVFEVYDLPRGTCQVSIDVPKGLEADFGYVSGPRKFSDRFPLTVTLGDLHATAVFYLKRADAK